MADIGPGTGKGTAAAGDHRAIRRAYAEGMVRLGVWYVRRLVSSGHLPAAEIADGLTRRVNLYRLTKLWDGHRDPALGHRDPRWDELSARLAGLVDAAPADELEERAVELLRPWLAGAVAPGSAPGSGTTFGCWSYQLVGEGVADAPGVLGRIGNPRKLWHKLRRLLGAPAAERHAELHFVNAMAPRSPFDEPRELARSLAELVVDCRRRHPAVRMLWCTSWLNSRPEFLALFPDSWRASAVERTPDDVDGDSFGRPRLNTDNWWGQFTRRDGGLNETVARRFRESGGVFPFANRVCHAPIEDVQRHLAGLLGTERPC